MMLEQLEYDEKLLNIISNKLSNAIMNNETFKQIVCDAVLLEVKEKVESLENNIQLSKSRNELLETKLEKQSQCSRRNCLVIYCKTIESNEETDTVVIGLISNKLGIPVNKEHLDRSHRLKSSNHNNPIIVKSISYNMRNQIYQNKRKLKGTGITIQETLASERRACIKKLSDLRRNGLILSYWTQDGNVFYSLPNNTQKNLSGIPESRRFGLYDFHEKLRHFVIWKVPVIDNLL